MQLLALLNGEVKHYDWGGTSYIPSLLQLENPQMTPYAEYWMGVHPQANCTIQLNNGAEVLLQDYINSDAAVFLGKDVESEFGQLPYLLKVLDVKNMLSIQVHPSKEQAALDFDIESKEGIPITAANRNYKDANHKPELMVALSEFYLLHGFKPKKNLVKVLKEVKELQIFHPVFEREGYTGLYRMAMELPQEEVNELLQPLINRIIPLYQQNKLGKETEDFWAARAALTFVQPNSIDRGIFSIYFFNIVHLKEGESIFQNAGVPHAYLEGQNVEIMASSDNVLRGGLTSKHIDTEELLKHTRCEATVPAIIKKDKTNTQQKFITPVRDFELSKYTLVAGEETTVTATTTEIFLITSGKVELKNDKTEVILKPGTIAAAAFAGASVSIKTLEPALLFRASVPSH